MLGPDQASCQRVYANLRESDGLAGRRQQLQHGFAVRARGP